MSNLEPAQRGDAKCILLNGSISSATSSAPKTSGTTFINLNKSLMSSRRRIPPSFCGYLDNLITRTSKNGEIFQVCGVDTFSKCKSYGKSMCYFHTRREIKGYDCFTQCHDDSFFGLAKSDSHLACKSSSYWFAPSNTREKRAVPLGMTSTSQV